MQEMQIKTITRSGFHVSGRRMCFNAHSVAEPVCITILIHGRRTFKLAPPPCTEGELTRAHGVSLSLDPTPTGTGNSASGRGTMDSCQSTGVERLFTVSLLYCLKLSLVHELHSQKL